MRFPRATRPGSGGPCTTPLRCSPHRSFQGADTHQRDSADATIMARGDSAFGTKKVIGACLDEQAEFSLTLSRNRRVTKAIESIDETSGLRCTTRARSKTPTPAR